MHRLSPRLRRPSAGLLLVLHLALLAAWAPHATASRDGTPLAHLERAGQSDCQVAHDDAGCGLCQLTATRVVVGALAVPRPPDARVTAAPCTDPLVPGSHSMTGCGHPRGPPKQAV
jgi:hypothetical protein